MIDAIYVDGKRYVNDSICDKINWLKFRANEIMSDKDLSDGEALQSLFNLVKLLSNEDQ